MTNIQTNKAEYDMDEAMEKRVIKKLLDSNFSITKKSFTGMELIQHKYTSVDSIYNEMNKK